MTVAGGISQKAKKAIESMAAIERVFFEGYADATSGEGKITDGEMLDEIFDICSEYDKSTEESSETDR